MVQSRFRAFVGIRDWNCMSGPVNYGIHYLKDTVGAPTNPGLANEICLNISDDRYYIFNGSVWIANIVLLGDRFIFSHNGSQLTGNGISAATMKLYEKHGDLQYYIIDPDSGQNILIKEYSLFYTPKSLLTYDDRINQWLVVKADAIVDSYTKSEINNFTSSNPGASLVGVYDNLTNSNATNVGDVLIDLDVAISSASANGEVNTCSNQGTAGVGVYYQKSIYDLQFKNINSSDTHVLVADDTINHEIDISTNATPNNTNSTIVSRNASGDFSAHSITADLNGSSDQVDNCDVDDSGTTTSVLWTASKILEEIDSKLNGISWQDPVEDKDLTSPPGSPANEERYIIPIGATGAWSGHDNDIAEWNGSSWEFFADTEGIACYVKDEDRLYTNNGTTWVTFGSVTTHNSLSGMQGGLANEYFHLSNNEYNTLTGSKTAKTFLAAPNGANGEPSFRAIADSDLPIGGTITVSGGSGLTGTGWFYNNQHTNANITISHVDSSASVTINNSNGNVLQDITIDTYGHTTHVGSTDLDNRYYTHTELANHTNATNSGAHLIGVFDEFGNSNSSNVQAVLNDLDDAISSTGGSIGNGQITIHGSSGLTGSGSFTTNQSTNTTVTINHANTSSQSSINNSNGVVIQDISVDTYGHLTSLGSVDLDLRYLGITAKATDSDKLDGHDYTYFSPSTHTHNYLPLSGGTITGNLTVQGDFYLGKNGGNDSRIFFYDDNSDTRRTFMWDDSVNDWRIEDNGGTYQKLWHAGNDGHTSGLDADLLDGYHASSFALTSSIGNGLLTISHGGGLAGSGTFNANQATDNTITLSHANTSSQSSVNNSNGVVIQDISVDTYGHVTVLGSIDLDARYDTTSVENATITLSAGSGMSGGGNFTTNQSSAETITFNHADTSSQSSINNSNGTVIQDISVDTYGHVTVLGSIDLDARYGSSAVENATITLSAGSGISGGGNFTTNQASAETITFNHANTSSQTSIDNSNGTVIQDISVDTYGHVTVLGSIDLDARYGGNGTTWLIKTSNYTAVNGEAIFADTSGGSFTITLPASPSIGDTVVVSDSSGRWDDYNLTIGRNGQKMNGLSENLLCDIKRCTIKLVFCNATYGWIIQ